MKMFWEFCLALQKFYEVETELLNLKKLMLAKSET